MTDLWRLCLDTFDGFYPNAAAVLQHFGSSTDRLANVTRPRRAPAGRPLAGVRADGSSGQLVRLQAWRFYDAPGSLRTPSPAFLQGRTICSEIETPRLSQWPFTGARCGVTVPSTWTPARTLAAAPPANMMFLETLRIAWLTPDATA